MPVQLLDTPGINLDDIVHILSGMGAPGTTELTDIAPLGTRYYDNSGNIWRKLSNGTGTEAWVNDTSHIRLLDMSGNIIVDTYPANLVSTAVWGITVTSKLDHVNQDVLIITGSHNGVEAKHTYFSNLHFGTGAPPYTLAVSLANGNFNLVLTPSLNVDIEVIRLSAFRF